MSIVFFFDSRHHPTTRVATRPVFAGTSRFSACLSRVKVERLPGR